MHVVDTVITVGWVVFWIYWLVAAVSVKATQTGQGRLSGLAPGFRVAIVILVVVLLRTGTLRGHEVTVDPWLRGIGFALFLLGLALGRVGQALPGPELGYADESEGRS